jgi:hypothetical protein
MVIMTATDASGHTQAPAFPRSTAALLLVWLGVAITLGSTGFWLRLAFPGTQLIILALTALVIAAGLRNAQLRAWLDAVPLRGLVGVHVVRLVGIVFLVLAAKGQLNPVFASRAGWGDIAVAVAAGTLALTGTSRRVTHVWNALGFTDLVVAVGTATVVIVRGAAPGMTPLFTFPLSLVPTFAVPLLLASHVFIFRKLRYS